MQLPRRDVIKMALAGAVGVATPASLVAAHAKLAKHDDRYLVIRLKGGNLMAVDLKDRNRTYLLEKKRAADGELRLRHAGSIVVKDGRLTGTKGRPESPGFSLFYEGEGDKRQVRNAATGKRQSLRRKPDA